jgi:hypothetical protein
MLRLAGLRAKGDAQDPSKRVSANAVSDLPRSKLLKGEHDHTVWGLAPPRMEFFWAQSVNYLEPGMLRHSAPFCVCIFGQMWRLPLFRVKQLRRIAECCRDLEGRRIHVRAAHKAMAQSMQLVDYQKYKCDRICSSEHRMT